MNTRILNLSSSRLPSLQIYPRLVICPSQLPYSLSKKLMGSWAMTLRWENLWCSTRDLMTTTRTRILTGTSATKLAKSHGRVDLFAGQNLPLKVTDILMRSRSMAKFIRLTTFEASQGCGERRRPNLSALNCSSTLATASTMEQQAKGSSFHFANPRRETHDGTVSQIS